MIMNGFSLQNYLSFRTLVAKVLSLTLTLGSGLPVGKEVNILLKLIKKILLTFALEKVKTQSFKMDVLVLNEI